MAYLYIDLETIPSQREDVREEIVGGIKPPANYKKEETIQKWMEENREEAIETELHKTCFDGTFGEIIAIGWAINDGMIRHVYRDMVRSEKDLLLEFMDFLYDDLETRKDGHLIKPTWVAHNGCDFDFRFLWQRCVVNNVKPVIPIPYDQKPWGRDVIDTLFEWKGTNKAGGSLDRICRALGVKGKDGFDGSMVYDAWKAGEDDKIAEYVRDDVRRVRDIHKRMNFNDRTETEIGVQKKD